MQLPSILAPVHSSPWTIARPYSLFNSSFNSLSLSCVLALTLTLTLAASVVLAQPAVELPRASPAATVSQAFGYTTATVSYSRPAVKGRVIWGGVVPYGQVWRAGANAATTLELTTDAKINGQALSKGKYGVFILPTEKEWTVIISKTSEAWGSFTYAAKDDALRVIVVPVAADPKERLEFAFEAINDSGAILTAHWDRLKASIPIAVEFLETGKAKILAGLPNAKGKPNEQYEWMNAARFYWDNHVDRKLAMEWIDKSIAIKAMHNNLWLKAEMLAASGKLKAAKKSAKSAREAALKDPAAGAYTVVQIDKGVASWGKGDEAAGNK